MRCLALLSALCLVAMPALAGMRADPVEWDIDGNRYSGFLGYDDASATKRPGLVMVPNWRGVNVSAVDKAKAIAGDDYVVLVADLYGVDVRPKDNAEAGRAATPLREDRREMRKRMRRAVEVLAAQAGRAPLDADRIGAFGYCFGGTAALELARDGAGVAGVVSLHGGLGTPLPAEAGAVEAPILVLNGADDSGIGDEDIRAFQDEMDKAGVDWQFVNFSGAVHCFAEPDAGSDPESNCRYHERSARRAHEMLRDFFRESFAL
jgi:dienelactone hydrolase